MHFKVAVFEWTLQEVDQTALTVKGLNFLSLQVEATVLNTNL